MAFYVCVDYSGGTVGESHPVPLFQTQQLHTIGLYRFWSMQILIEYLLELANLDWLCQMFIHAGFP